MASCFCFLSQTDETIEVPLLPLPPHLSARGTWLSACDLCPPPPHLPCRWPLTSSPRPRSRRSPLDAENNNNITTDDKKKNACSFFKCISSFFFYAYLVLFFFIISSLSHNRCCQCPLLPPPHIQQTAVSELYGGRTSHGSASPYGIKKKGGWITKKRHYGTFMFTLRY